MDKQSKIVRFVVAAGIIAAAVLAAFIMTSAVQAPSTVPSTASSAASSTYGQSAYNTADDTGKTAVKKQKVKKKKSRKPKGLSKKLPYIGLSAKYIDETWLGKHDEYDGKPIEGGQKEGAVTYTWTSDNGKNDPIFKAYVRDGKVIAVLRDNLYTDYWPGDIACKYPNLKATGRSTSEDTEVPPDVSDYSSPSAYADSEEEWFRDNGYKNPYDAAYAYWEEWGDYDC